MQNWGRELERSPQAHLSPQGQSEDHTWALLTCGATWAPVCQRPTTPTSWADCPVSPFCGLMFNAWQVWVQVSVPRGSNPKCNTFAISLLHFFESLNFVWSNDRDGQKLLTVGNFFSAIICVYPDKKKKEGWWTLCSIPGNWNSKMLYSII